MAFTVTYVMKNSGTFIPRLCSAERQRACMVKFWKEVLKWNSERAENPDRVADFKFGGGWSSKYNFLGTCGLTWLGGLGEWLRTKNSGFDRVARFLFVPKTGKIYQMIIKYTNWSQSTPNDHKIPNGYVGIPKIYKHFPFQVLPKFSHIGSFGMQIPMYQLATVVFKRENVFFRVWWGEGNRVPSRLYEGAAVARR
jgi:hypothetical protein